MKVVVSGGTGFIGSALVQRLIARGDEVAVLTRGGAAVAGVEALSWDGRSDGPWVAKVAEADAVVNLAGASIADGRWTDARKKLLVSSRLDATRAIVAAFRCEPGRRRVLVHGSAVGFYGLRGDEMLNEEASAGSGFLADLSRAWEAAALEAVPIARVAVLRFGVVLGSGGGALPKMLMPFRLGVGGPVGSGRQWMSWIHLDDAVRLVMWALDGDSATGVYNATAPAPVRNADFARAAGKALRRPSFFPTPAPVLRLAFGEMANELLLGGQRVVPQRALREGFQFEAESIEAALQRIL